MRKKCIFIILLCLVVSHLFIMNATAAIITVKKYGGADYTSIQEAVNNANNGDIIKVGSGVFYENVVINNKNIELLGSGATGVIPDPPLKTLGYIVNTDYITAFSYRALLVSMGFSVILVDLDDVAITNLSAFDLIIVGPDTGSLDEWGTTGAVSAMQTYNGPILGLGEGGYAFFGKLALHIGFPHGIHAGSILSTYVVDTNHEIWNLPNNIFVPFHREVSLYSTPSGTVAIYMPDPIKDVSAIGRFSLSLNNHYSLIKQSNRFFLWGFGGSPAIMSQTGKNVMENVINHLFSSTSSFPLIARELILPSKKIISPTIQVPSWWEISVLRPDWWRFLLPRGTTISGNGSGNVIRVINATSGRIDGFSIANSGPDYAGIRLDNSSIDISNNRVTQNGDGIYAWQSPSVIRNNKIDNNGADNGVVDYAIICNRSSLGIFNNLIVNNNEVGIYVFREESNGASIINNTIDNNDNDGIWCNESSPTIKNNIITNNSRGIAAIYGAAPNISYNDVWNNTQNYNQQTGGIAGPGPGDISGAPLFIDASNGDYHLNAGSPCIDAGDPDPIFNDPDGTRNDMGAYGGFGTLSGPGGGEESGFIFTSIGKIPVSEIVQDDMDPSFGLANVADPNIADALHIYQWRDSPFGGSLWLYGLFGENDDVDYYQILVGKWDGNTEPDANDYVPLNTPLTKVKYNIIGGKVHHEYVSMGPETKDGIPSLYRLNKGGYWSQPDLRMVWKTRAKTLEEGEYVPVWENGKYTLKYRAFRIKMKLFLIETLEEVTPDPGDPNSLPETSQDHITIIINNSQVTTQIRWVKYDPTSPEYDPLVDGNIQECGIIRLQDNQENLRFVITASHPDGYLDYYRLRCLYGKNHSGGTIQYENYLTSPSATPPLWYGVTNQEFQTDDTPSSSGYWNHWENCAYQFRLTARSRATDGYVHLYWREFSDHYFIDLGATCLPAIPGDINNDGVVSIDELTLVINAFLGNIAP